MIEVTLLEKKAIMEMEFKICIKKTAVVVIDLQKGITARSSEPYPPGLVIENTVSILNSARKNKMAVFLVHVTPSPDFKDSLKPVAQSSFSHTGFPEDWADYVPELNIQRGDFLITKRQWGAFYGTELDLQLRRRGINTIILCGISTNKGVESTARFAYEYGYNQIFVEDAMAARTKAEHEFPLKYTFPLFGVIVKTRELIKKLEEE